MMAAPDNVSMESVELECPNECRCRNCDPAVATQSPDDKKNAVVFLDLKTTGLNVKTSDIVQIYACAYYVDDDFNLFSHYFKELSTWAVPEKYIQKDASAVNGLYTATLLDGEKILVDDKNYQLKAVDQAVLQEMISLFFDEVCHLSKNVYVVAYNGKRFDFPLFANSWDRNKPSEFQDFRNFLMKKGCKIYFCDMMQYACEMYEKVGDMEQPDLYYKVKQSTYPAHNAYFDVQAMIEIHKTLCKERKEEWVKYFRTERLKVCKYKEDWVNFFSRSRK